MTALAHSCPTPQPAFGLYQIDGKYYLFQDTMPDGHAIGTIDEPIIPSGRNTDYAGIGGACTHNINPFLIHRRIPKCQWARFTELVKDPLVELFLPVPMAAKRFTKNVLLLDNTFNPSWFFMLKTLERLSSPVHSKVDQWVDEYQHKRLSDLTLSNLQPLVYSLTERHLKPQTELDILRLAHEANKSTWSRPVLLTGNTTVIKTLKLLLGNQAEVLETELADRSLVTNIMHLPFEHMGSRVLGYYGMNKVLQVC